MFPFLAWFLSEDITGPNALRQWVAEVALEATVEWFVENFVRPIVGAFLFVGETIINVVLIAAFGQDRAIGGPAYGLADIWLGVVPLLERSGDAFGSILGVIDEFNAALAELAATGGLAAPTIVTLLYVAELATAGYLLWSLIRVIDVPLISLDGLVQVLTAPLQFAIRRLR